VERLDAENRNIRNEQDVLQSQRKMVALEVKKQEAEVNEAQKQILDVQREKSARLHG
jgi:hypothetical protein